MIITINLDTILDRIYADSAWYSAYDPTIPCLTPDNQRYLEIKIEDGLNDIRARIAPYINKWNYNPHIDTHNIILGLAIPDTPPITQCHIDPPAIEGNLHDTIKALIIELLAQYALARFYNDDRAHFSVAWQAARARLTILLSHPAFNP